MSKLLFDPELIPIASIAGEAAVAHRHLTSDWLSERFAAPVPWTPEFTDEHRLRSDEKQMTPASVLLPIVRRTHGLTLLFTQRTAHLTDHGGQVSFPGGRAEQHDQSPIETALRETEEEIGLHRRHIDVIGMLPDYMTGTGFQVTPVVALVSPPFELRPEPFEVAEIFEVPLTFLMNGVHHQRRTVELPGGAGIRTFYAMPYERFFIWGATAGMLRNLFHFLRAS